MPGTREAMWTNREAVGMVKAVKPPNQDFSVSSQILWHQVGGSVSVIQFVSLSLSYLICMM